MTHAERQRLRLLMFDGQSELLEVAAEACTLMASHLVYMLMAFTLVCQ